MICVSNVYLLQEIRDAWRSIPGDINPLAKLLAMKSYCNTQVLTFNPIFFLLYLLSGGAFFFFPKENTFISIQLESDL